MLPVANSFTQKILNFWYTPNGRGGPSKLGTAPFWLFVFTTVCTCKKIQKEEEETRTSPWKKITHSTQNTLRKTTYKKHRLWIHGGLLSLHKRKQKWTSAITALTFFKHTGVVQVDENNNQKHHYFLINIFLWNLGCSKRKEGVLWWFVNFMDFCELHTLLRVSMKCIRALSKFVIRSSIEW